MVPPTGSLGSVAHREGGGKYVTDAAAALSTSLQNLQTVLENENFDVLFGLFSRISKGGSHACSGAAPAGEGRSTLSAGLGHEISQGCGASLPQYCTTRPSTASTALPSSSLSLSSASIEPTGGSVRSQSTLQTIGASSGHPDFHLREQRDVPANASRVREGGSSCASSTTGADDYRHGGACAASPRSVSNASFRVCLCEASSASCASCSNYGPIEARAANPSSAIHETFSLSDGAREEESKGSARATHPAVNDCRSPVAATPARDTLGPTSASTRSKSKTKLNAAAAVGAGVTYSRRSPRLKRHQASTTPQKGRAESPPAVKSPSAQQAKDTASRQAETVACRGAAAKRGRGGARGGRRRQEAAADAASFRGGSARKRRRDDEEADSAQPDTTASPEPRTPHSEDAADSCYYQSEAQGGVQTPLKSGVAPSKRKCALRADQARTRAPGETPAKQSGRAKTNSMADSNGEALQLEEGNDAAGAPYSAVDVASVAAAAAASVPQTENKDGSEAGDHPLCHSSGVPSPLKVRSSESIEGTKANGGARADGPPQTALVEEPQDDALQQQGASAGPENGPVCSSGCVSEDSAAALQHKVLRALPQPTPQFDFGLFVVRAASLSKHVDDVFPLLDDDELMERSVVLTKFLAPAKDSSHRRGDRLMLEKLVAEIPKSDGLYKPHQDIQEAPWCSGVEGDKHGSSRKDVLLRHVQEQRKWNPFSIFGSSPPSVELEDVFGFETYQNTAPSARVHHPLFRRLSQFYPFKDLYSSLSREEWDKVSSAFRHHWHKQCRLDLDWTNDPLTVDEIMWMLEAQQQVEDRSSDVYEAEICYCVTPNPNVGFGWNDPRCHRYKAPRPSMGCHILQPELTTEMMEGTVASPGEADAGNI